MMKKYSVLNSVRLILIPRRDIDGNGFPILKLFRNHAAVYPATDRE